MIKLIFGVFVNTSLLLLIFFLLKGDQLFVHPFFNIVVQLVVEVLLEIFILLLIGL